MQYVIILDKSNIYWCKQSDRVPSKVIDRFVVFIKAVPLPFNQ